MISGQRPKPTALKLLENNPGGRPLNEQEPIVDPILDTPKPPRKLPKAGMDEWDRCMPFCIRNGLIGPEALNLLATYCYLTAKEVAAERKGELLPCAFIAQMRMLAEIFGFTPSGRARIKTGNGKKEEDEAGRFFG
jgi:phage terminase small subunit